MATQKIIEDLDRNKLDLKNAESKDTKKSQISELVCDVCGSIDIVKEREGYICRDCGIVLEIQKLEY